MHVIRLLLESMKAITYNHFWLFCWGGGGGQGRTQDFKLGGAGDKRKKKF